MNENSNQDTTSLNPRAAAFLEWMNLRYPGALTPRTGKGGNPYSCPRPRPFTIEDYFEGSVIDWCFERANLLGQLEDNLDWLCHAWRTTGEIYRALFREVDPGARYRREGVEFIKEGMRELGFRCEGEESKSWSQVWYLPDQVAISPLDRDNLQG